MNEATAPATALDRGMILTAAGASLRKLDPRVQFHNPVMFVVEIGAVVTTVAWLVQLTGGVPLGGGDEPAWFSFTVAIWLWLTVVFGNVAEALGRGPRQGPGRLAPLRADRGGRPDGRRHRAGGVRAPPRRRRRRRGGGGDPRRRHRDRGHRVGRRVGHHRRIGARDPRVGRRPQRRHRRHAGAQRPDRRPDHPGAGPELPRPDDLPRRGRGEAEDAERGRAQHPVGGVDADLPRRRRDAAAVRRVRRYGRIDRDARRPADRPDPDDDRRPALGDRHRRHGPARPPQRPGALGSRRRGVRRRRRPAPRQDRHDHARQPPGLPLHPDARRRRDRAGRGRAARLAGRRDPRGPVDRDPRQGATRDPRARARRASCDVRPLHRGDADERRRHRRAAAPQGRRRRREGLGRGRGREDRRPSSTPASRRSPARAERRWRSPATARSSASSTSRTSSRRG